MKSFSAIAILTLRIILGAALAIAGAIKVGDPAAFAAAIGTFQILPASLVPLAALGLPFLEIAIGAQLLFGWRLRAASFAALILFGLYTGALAIGLARRLPLECDCFGASVSAPLALLRDLILFTGAAFLYTHQLRRSLRSNEVPD